MDLAFNTIRCPSASFARFWTISLDKYRLGCGCSFVSIDIYPWVVYTKPGSADLKVYSSSSLPLSPLLELFISPSFRLSASTNLMDPSIRRAVCIKFILCGITWTWCSITAFHSLWWWRSTAVSSITWSDWNRRAQSRTHASNIVPSPSLWWLQHAYSWSWPFQPQFSGLSSRSRLTMLSSMSSIRFYTLIISCHFHCTWSRSVSFVEKWFDWSPAIVWSTRTPGRPQCHWTEILEYSVSVEKGVERSTIVLCCFRCCLSYWCLIYYIQNQPWCMECSCRVRCRLFKEAFVFCEHCAGHEGKYRWIRIQRDRGKTNYSFVKRFDFWYEVLMKQKQKIEIEKHGADRRTTEKERRNYCQR